MNIPSDYNLLDRDALTLLCSGIITRREYDCWTAYLETEFMKACEMQEK